MERTVTSWPGRQRLAEPTEMWDFLQPLLTHQLEKNTKRRISEIKRRKVVCMYGNPQGSTLGPLVLGLRLWQQQIVCRCNKLHLLSLLYKIVSPSSIFNTSILLCNISSWYHNRVKMMKLWYTVTTNKWREHLGSCSRGDEGLQNI